MTLFASIQAALFSCDILHIRLYNIIYDPNGETSGAVPADSNSYAPAATVTVLGNTGNLANTGYSFAGWNTKADATGTNYAAGSTFTMGSANVTLYARWIIQFSSVAVRDYYTMILRTDGTLWATGRN